MHTIERQAGTNFILSDTDPLNRRTAYGYDAMGNLTSVTRLSGTSQAVTTNFTYEPTFNQIATVTDPLNHTNQFGYDSRGSLTSVTDPLNNQTTIAYNAAGQPVSVTDPLMNMTQFQYQAGDLTTVTNPLGQSFTRFVDAGGRLISLTNPLGQLARIDYDSLNQPTRVTDPLQGVTSFGYDPNGNLLSVTDARNKTTSYSYDNMDRVATRTDPLLRQESYLYDANGNLRQVTDRKNQVTTYSYDSLDRLTLVIYADYSTTSYNYDNGSRLTSVVDSISGTISYGYDNLDRVTFETTTLGTVSYTYDAAGRRTSMTVITDSPALNYFCSYDSADRLTQMTQGSSTVTIAYDAASRRTSLGLLPNDVFTQYGYDIASRLTSITYKKDKITLGNLTYDYDAVGRVDKLGGSFARTGLPQPVSVTSYNAANQQTSFGSQTLTYENNGNLTSDGINSYGWNARDQLVSISGPGLSATFLYDAAGRRISKSINAASIAYLYDGANVAQEQVEREASANMLMGGIDELFARTDYPGVTSSALVDGLGSVLALTDSAGTVQTQYTYEPFGETTALGASSTNPSQYTGRENDGTGLYYYRARYYSPVLQRFISEDPIGYGGRDTNFYAYVGNDPISSSDPFGLKPMGLYGAGAHGQWPPRLPNWARAGGRQWWQEPEVPNGPVDTPGYPPGDPQAGRFPRVGPPENLEDAYGKVRPPQTYNPHGSSKPNFRYPTGGSWWSKLGWAGSKVAEMLKPIFEHFGGPSDFIIILTPPDVIKQYLRHGTTCSPMQSYLRAEPPAMEHPKESGSPERYPTRAVDHTFAAK